MKIQHYIFVSFVFLVLGCKDYTSVEYITEEDKAIQQLIPEFTDLDNMFLGNQIEDNSVKLIIVSQLNTNIRFGDSLEKRIIKEESGNNHQQFEMVESASYKEETDLFIDFIDGSIQERKVDHKFTHPRLEIITKQEDKDNHFFNQVQSDSTLFGCLWISRISFDNSFETGYLSYFFYCGQGCAWNNNIEIKKIDGQWIITRRFSGGIA